MVWAEESYTEISLLDHPPPTPLIKLPYPHVVMIIQALKINDFCHKVGPLMHENAAKHCSMNLLGSWKTVGSKY